MEAEISLLREFEEVFIPVPWGHIAGRWFGQRNVRPILALHGWLDNYGTWDNFIPLMPPHISVLAIDFPGHGKSSRLPAGVTYHIMNYGADIIRVMQHYNWDKVSIMAHSMGSLLSFVFAAFYPERIDMLIQLDSLHPYLDTPKNNIAVLNYCLETFLLEEKRIRDSNFMQPPSYSDEELIQRVHEGSSNSVDKDKCKHIIQTNVAKSTLYPSKYYFSRDPRVKIYFGFFATPEYLLALANRIKVPQILIKATDSNHVDQDDPVVELLQKNNPYFEFHILQGTHHMHLNDPQETSVLVNNFLRKWKPQPDILKLNDVQPQLKNGVRKLLDGRMQRAKL